MSQNNQRVVHGDVFEGLDSLAADTFHAAVLDYPWEMKIQRGDGESEYRGTGERAPTSGYRERGHDGEMYEIEDDDGFADVLTLLSRVLVDGAWIICFADDRFQDVVRSQIRASEDLILRRNWAWTPESLGMGYYGRVSHYPIPVATIGETDRYVQDRGTLYSIPGGRKTNYPTGKPVELYRQLLAQPVIEDGERLCEPFCGSGPGAAVACERDLGYWGCDVDDGAVELARDHFKQSRLNSNSSGGDHRPRNGGDDP